MSVNRRIKTLGFILILPLMAIAMVAEAYAQSSGVQIFSLPDTGTSAQWVELGTFSAPQQGNDIDIKIVASSGFNATSTQDQVSYIHFKTSNGSSLNGDGFAGDSWWYQTGPNNSSPSQVVWVANAPGGSATAFTLFANFGIWTGNDSYYVVDAPPGTTWTNVSLAGQTNPGGGSSTVAVAQNQFFVVSSATFTNAVNFGSVATFNKSVGLSIGNYGNTGPTVQIGDGGYGFSSDGGGLYEFDDGSGMFIQHKIMFPDGSQQATAWTGVLCGGDYAESVDVTGDRTKYEPGDVLVIDPKTPGKFLKSAEPYSTMVTGIYSTKPGALGRRLTGPKSPDEVPMAMIGIVPTKVSAENGSIRPGDLLVTSTTLGYAMKGTDRNRMLGAVIGKALGSLDSGTGTIEVAVMLQ